ncbi:hypothetical protein EYF80_035761 [Liparis tanakae]|uniref:Uncharacterized protein n=1 Tax=Liparis tanakae TaxID=230148 RepID=A0A4Z2GKI6_9TELE|nr:hypothetical protein EYF80_035761 [Liparis tanakae]
METEGRAEGEKELDKPGVEGPPEQTQAEEINQEEYFVHRTLLEDKTIRPKRMDPAWSVADLFRPIYPSACHPGFLPVYQPKPLQPVYQPPSLAAPGNSRCRLGMRESLLRFSQGLVQSPVFQSPVFRCQFQSPVFRRRFQSSMFQSPVFCRRLLFPLSRPAPVLPIPSPSRPALVPPVPSPSRSASCLPVQSRFPSIRALESHVKSKKHSDHAKARQQPAIASFCSTASIDVNASTLDGTSLLKRFIEAQILNDITALQMVKLDTNAKEARSRSSVLPYQCPPSTARSSRSSVIPQQCPPSVFTFHSALRHTSLTFSREPAAQARAVIDLHADVPLSPVLPTPPGGQYVSLDRGYIRTPIKQVILFFLD